MKSTRNRLLMYWSSKIFSPMTLSPRVIPMAAQKPIIICRKASADRLAVVYRCPIEVIR